VRAREARERAMMALINLIVFANMSQGVEEVGKTALLRGGGKGAQLYTQDIACTVAFQGISDDAHHACRSEAIRFFDEI
jgi:hypothetical protein